MADADLDAVRWKFADLTCLFEDAALLASAGQDIRSLDYARRQCKCIVTTMTLIRRRLVILEERLR